MRLVDRRLEFFGEPREFGTLFTTQRTLVDLRHQSRRRLFSALAGGSEMRYIWVGFLIAVNLGKERTVLRRQDRFIARHTLGGNRVDVQASAEFAQIGN